MIDASSALQTAVIALLRADTAVTAIVGDRIYASAPDNTLTAPHITLGPSDAVRFFRADRRGSSNVVQVDCWVQAGTDARDQMKRCRDLVAAACGALDMKKPAVAGWHLFGAFIADSTRVLSDPDGVTAHGVITLRAEMAPA